MFNFNKILLCADGSDEALKAATKATALARNGNAPLLLLHVHDENKSPCPPFTVAWQMDEVKGAAANAAEREQQEIIDGTAEILRKAGVPFQVIWSCGHPAEEITRIAQQENVDVIVMGSRGLTSLQSLIMGSVSSHVMHQAHCSVLIVR